MRSFLDQLFRDQEPYLFSFADVVLAMFLRGDRFDRDQKRRNFDYYSPLTTGDSSMSATVVTNTRTTRCPTITSSIARAAR